jgi:hypothetical protein
VAILENAVENELDQVLARGAISRVVHEKTVQRTVVAFEKLTELADFARANRNHEFVVGEGIHGWRRRFNHGRG